MAGREIGRYHTAGTNVAIIFGVTGLVGRELVRRLISSSKWKVYGVARNPDIIPIKSLNYHFISCDLLCPLEIQEKLSSLEDVTHMFWITWASQFPLDSKDCCEQNKAMMSNALHAILPAARNLRHVSLQTGMKHYVSLQGTFEDHIQIFDEECPRISSCANFYYVLEDLLKEKLASKIAWSVHRPGLIVGSSCRTLYNFMGSISVYGSICKHLNLPFVFGGTKQCWEEFCIDGSDAGIVAEQHIWAACNEKIYSSDGQAFNAINGPRFTWKEIWPALGKSFGAEVPETMFNQDLWYSKVMADKKGIWEEVIEKEGLLHTDIADLANWEFLDVLFRCPVRLLGTRNKADRLGFTKKCKTLDSMLYWIQFMRSSKLIP